MATANTGNQYTPGAMQQTQQQLQVASTYQSDPKSYPRRIPAVRYFGVFSLITAFLLCGLGITAVVMQAANSYMGSAIWTGLLFALPTGILGLRSYRRPNRCTKVAYLVMNLLTCIMCAHLVIGEPFNVIFENSGYGYWICSPLPGDIDRLETEWIEDTRTWYIVDYEDIKCTFSQMARRAVDGLIFTVALAHFFVSIVSMVFTCYGTFLCCYKCCPGCREAPEPEMLVYVKGNQIPAGFQQVNLVPDVQPTQPGQVTSPIFRVVPGQLQPQTADSQNQLPPTQMIVMPHIQTTGMPQNQMTTMPQNQIIPQAILGGIGQEIISAAVTLDQASNAANSRPDEIGHTVKEQDELTYGNTTTGSFHDRTNLLESV